MAALTNDAILDAIANMTVQQAADLVKAMEEKFGVTAAAPVAVAAAPAAAEAEEEQTEFTVTLESIDPTKKMDVIKAVKAATGLGLKDAMAIVTGAPKVIKEGVSKADADKLVADITAAGGKVSKK